MRNAAEVKPAANTAKIDAFKGADGSGMATSATPERAKRNRARSGTAKGSRQSKWEANPDRRGWNLRFGMRHEYMKMNSPNTRLTLKSIQTLTPSKIIDRRVP